MKPTKKGIYTPVNLKKYIGSKLPTYRSSWQLKAFVSLDRNPNVCKWGSQGIVIPYVDTTRNNETHKYYVDLFFEIADATQNGLPIKWLIEIKPSKQSTIQKITKRTNPVVALEASEIVIRNQCKWKAAIAFCQAKGWHFGVYTEKGIDKLC